MTSPKKQVLILIPAAIIVSLLYFYFDPELNKFFPPCPFYHLTGLFCPGCGSQRAFHDLVHGHPVKAAEHNLLFVLFLPMIILSSVIFILDVFFKKKITSRLFTSAIFTRLILCTILLFWVLRNIHIEPFSWLAP